MNKIISDNNPLVSVIVITYNSSKYVLETLESAKAQTYQNIELIVSDDCSSDNTVEICRNWIEENKDRFVRTELITIEKNTGIAPNCNRGLYIAEGEWVKFIAGDDILYSSALTDASEYIKKTDNEMLIFASDVESFIGNNKNDIVLKSNYEYFFKKNITAEIQLQMIQERIPFCAAGVFFKRNLFEIIGTFDENFPMVEDYPIYIKILKNNIRIYYLNKKTAYYRLHSESVTGYSYNEIFNKHFKKSYKLDMYLFGHDWPRIKVLSRKYTFYLQLIFNLLNINKKEYRHFYYLLSKLNIFNFYIKISRKYILINNK